jgi:hypothetical protein
MSKYFTQRNIYSQTKDVQFITPQDDVNKSLALQTTNHKTNLSTEYCKEWQMSGLNASTDWTFVLLWKITKQLCFNPPILFSCFHVIYLSFFCISFFLCASSFSAYVFQSTNDTWSTDATLFPPFHVILRIFLHVDSGSNPRTLIENTLFLRNIFCCVYMCVVTISFGVCLVLWLL